MCIAYFLLSQVNENVQLHSSVLYWSLQSTLPSHIFFALICKNKHKYDVVAFARESCAFDFLDLEL